MDFHQKRNEAIKKETAELVKVTENLSRSNFITQTYTEADDSREPLSSSSPKKELEIVAQKEAANLINENKENEATVVIRKNKKIWTCPEIEAIDQSCFDSLHRQQKVV